MNFILKEDIILFTNVHSVWIIYNYFSDTLCKYIPKRVVAIFPNVTVNRRFLEVT